jgi:hypothetical protein
MVHVQSPAPTLVTLKPSSIKGMTISTKLKTNTQKNRSGRQGTQTLIYFNEIVIELK